MLFLHTGLHDGYHTPRGHIELVNTPDITRAARLGITWRVDEADPGALVLIGVAADSPAAKVDLCPSDRIYQINGQDFADWFGIGCHCWLVQQCPGILTGEPFDPLSSLSGHQAVPLRWRSLLDKPAVAPSDNARTARRRGYRSREIKGMLEDSRPLYCLPLLFPTPLLFPGLSSSEPVYSPGNHSAH